MVILDRKIVHNVQTMCSHITYTEFNLPFHLGMVFIAVFDRILKNMLFADEDKK